MVNKDINDLISSFRSSRGQQSVPHKNGTPRERKTSGADPYTTFKRKYVHLEQWIDLFGTRDLVYYFREIAEENGQRYVIANMAKDQKIMKRLKQSFSNREICGMIEFLFTSEQDYLDKDRLSINLLASNWINTIYADTKLWVNDEYIPRKSKQSMRQHEWDKSVASDEVKIGVKL